MYILCILIIILILYYKKLKNSNKLNKIKKIDIVEELNIIKEKFNNRKDKIVFNKNNLPIKIETKSNNINRLFHLLFKNSDINVLNIIDIKIKIIEIQKQHEVVVNTNHGLILIIMLSERNEKEDIFNDDEKIIEKNYLLKLEYLNNYNKVNNNLDIDKYLKNKKKKLINETGIDLNPSIKMFDLNNIM